MSVSEIANISRIINSEVLFDKNKFDRNLIKIKKFGVPSTDCF